jgi:hypothetical protein
MKILLLILLRILRECKERVPHSKEAAEKILKFGKKICEIELEKLGILKQNNNNEEFYISEPNEKDIIDIDGMVNLCMIENGYSNNSNLLN